MNNMNIPKLVKEDEEMIKTDDEELKNITHILWVMYSSFIREGFTKQQAMSLIKTMLSPRVGG